jgi:hypothetical protein
LHALRPALPASAIIDLLCAQPGDEVPADDALTDLLPEDAQIHRIAPFPRGRRTLLQRIIGGQGGWQKEAVHKAAALFPAEHKKPALIYSRSHPPASHLVAIELVRGPFAGVPWIAHFTEPWSLHPYYRSPITRRALRLREQDVMAAATQLVFGTEALRDAMTASAADLLAKSHVVRSPAEWPHAETSPSPLQAQPGSRVLAHVGSLHAARSPLPLFEGLAELQRTDSALQPRLEAWLVGSYDQTHAGLAEQLGVAECVRRSAPLPYAQSLAVMRSADVLLVLDTPAKDNVFLPTKLTDYLAARKPILALTSPGSLTAKVMDRWQQPWADMSDSSAVAAALRQAASGQLRPAPDERFLAEHAPAATGKALAEVVDECLAPVISQEPAA